MRVALFGLLLISLFACTNKPRIPENVLPEAKMRTVLWDIMRADEWVVHEQNQDSTVDRYKRSMELYQKVFQINGITDSQFKTSFRYYQSRPELLKPLFDSLQRRSPRLDLPVQ